MASSSTQLCLGHLQRLGYPVRGGYATCKVWEGTSPLEARYYVGSDSPDSPTWTGDLIFVDDITTSYRHSRRRTCDL